MKYEIETIKKEDGEVWAHFTNMIQGNEIHAIGETDADAIRALVSLLED